MILNSSAHSDTQEISKMIIGKNKRIKG